MKQTNAFTERCAILGKVNVNSQTAGTYQSDVVDMRFWSRVAIVLVNGTLGNNGTVQVVANANAANSSSGGTAITGKTFTAANFSGSGSGTAGGSLSEGIIEVTAPEVNTAVAGGRYLYATLTVGTATSVTGLYIIGIDPRYNVTAGDDLASVKQIVT